MGKSGTKSNRSTELEDALSVLQSELEQKQSVIDALTERLEHAAERIDRMQRRGTPDGPPAPSGLTCAMDRQQELLQDLHGAVFQHDAPSAFERIETRIAELSELVLEAAAAGPHSAPPASHSAPIGNAAEPPQAAARSESTPPAGSSYEAFKSQVLAADEPAVEPQAGDETADSTDDVSPSRSPVLDLDHSEIDEPEPIDLDTADVEELKLAVDSRDAYITWLICRVRLLESHHLPTGCWQALENVPEELRERLTQLSEHMERTLKDAELELSLERARLSREATKLAHRENELRKQLERESVDDARESSCDGSSPEEKSKERRWFRMLKLGRDS